MIYCSVCGKGIPADSRFCTFCGATVPEVDPQKPNIATPSSATPPNVTGSTVSRDYLSTGRTLQFYENPGFYGALLIIIGYFIPWFNIDDITGIDLMNYYFEDLSGAAIFILVLMILPLLAALLIIIQSFTRALPRAFTGLFKWLSFIGFFGFLALLTIGMSQDGSDSSIIGIDLNNPNAGAIFSFIGIGLWLCIAGAILMLFNRRMK